MKLLDEYNEVRQAIFDYFGHVEDYRVIPLDDARDYYWHLEGEGPGQVHFADMKEELVEQTGNYYVDEIYTQRFLDKWVYRGEQFTMICCDPQTDGNKFLRIFDNSKEILEEFL